MALERSEKCLSMLCLTQCVCESSTVYFWELRMNLFHQWPSRVAWRHGWCGMITWMFERLLYLYSLNNIQEEREDMDDVAWLHGWVSGFFSLGSVCVTSERLLVPRVIHSLAYCSPLPLLLILPYIRERADSLPCLFSFPLFLSPPLHLEHPTSVLEIFLSLVRKTWFGHVVTPFSI